MMGIRLKCFLFLLFIFSCIGIEPCLGQSGLVFHSKIAIDFEVQGYCGLKTISIYQRSLAAGESLNVETPYYGLAMLIFSGGKKYPVIIGRQSSEVIITGPDEPSAFIGGDENELFYQLLSGSKSADKGNGFVGLMIQGKELLDSSSAIQSVEELHAEKVEFQEFVKNNYLELSRSDLLRRLIAQYFMMHEYVSYHIEGSGAGAIRERYQREVLAGVAAWLSLLKDRIPQNEILNYCVGLYYNRGMVTVASLIAESFRDIAYCEGENPNLSNLPAHLKLIGADGTAAGKLGDLKGEKMFSFVSSDCPVSMVMTVMKARETVAVKGHKINRSIVVLPLEKLSVKHRAMSRNVSGSRMLFVDDALWGEKNLQNIGLPLIKKIPVQ